MQNKETNLKLMKLITELNDGVYEVNTSKGKFKIETSTKVKSANYRDHCFYRDDIKITDENGNLFSHYYFCKNRDDLGCHTYENGIDISDNIKFEHGYDIDYNNHNIKIYLNSEHTKYYLISEKDITKWENTSCKRLVEIYKNSIFGQNLAIDLKTFDRMIFINYLRDAEVRIAIADGFIKVPKEKDIEKELNTVKEKIKYIENDEYLKHIIDKKLIEKLKILDLDLSVIKQEEKKLIELSKIYLKTLSIRNNTHELSIMREIVDGLKPEFNKLSAYVNADDKSLYKKKTILKPELARKPTKIDCTPVIETELFLIKDLKKQAAYWEP